MKKLANISLVLVVTAVVGYFIDPMTAEGAKYGIPLGIGIGLAWAIGFMAPKD